MDITIKQGGSYLIQEQKNNRSIELLLSYVKKDQAGMIVSRTAPSKLSNISRNARISILWITDIKTDIQHVKPHHLEQICYSIESFIFKNKRSIVLFSGLEYLASFTSFNQVLHVIQNLRDIASVNNAIMIFSAGVGTFSKQEQSLLEQELEVLK